MGNTELERLSRLEAQVEQMMAIIIRMEAKLDAQHSLFVSKEILSEKLATQETRLAAQDVKINDLQQEIKDMQTERAQEKQNTKTAIPTWLSTVGTLAAVVVAVFAIIYSK